MANLTDEELRQAAAEAGISPQELRMALAERNGGLPANPDANSSVGALTRGESAAHVESRIQEEPTRAVESVRSSIERQIGKKGHRQGDGQVDIVDGDTGLTYKLRGTSDGAGGALVRVDVDSAAARGGITMMAAAVAAFAGVFGVVGVLFGLTFVGLTGLGIGVGGAALVFRNFAKLQQNVAKAQASAAHGLMEAEDRAASQAALGPGSSS